MSPAYGYLARSRLREPGRPAPVSGRPAPPRAAFHSIFQMRAAMSCARDEAPGLAADVVASCGWSAVVSGQRLVTSSRSEVRYKTDQARRDITIVVDFLQGVEGISPTTMWKRGPPHRWASLIIEASLAGDSLRLRVRGRQQEMEEGQRRLQLNGGVRREKGIALHTPVAASLTLSVSGLMLCWQAQTVEYWTFACHEKPGGVLCGLHRVWYRRRPQRRWRQTNDTNAGDGVPRCSVCITVSAITADDRCFRPSSGAATSAAAGEGSP